MLVLNGPTFDAPSLYAEVAVLLIGPASWPVPVPVSKLLIVTWNEIVPDWPGATELITAVAWLAAVTPKSYVTVGPVP